MKHAIAQWPWLSDFLRTKCTTNALFAFSSHMRSEVMLSFIFWGFFLISKKSQFFCNTIYDLGHWNSRLDVFLLTKWGDAFFLAKFTSSKVCKFNCNLIQNFISSTLTPTIWQKFIFRLFRRWSSSFQWKDRWLSMICSHIVIMAQKQVSHHSQSSQLSKHLWLPIISVSHSSWDADTVAS